VFFATQFGCGVSFRSIGSINLIVVSCFTVNVNPKQFRMNDEEVDSEKMDWGRGF
jgi:hypothetical protein